MRTPLRIRLTQIRYELEFIWSDIRWLWRPIYCFFNGHTLVWQRWRSDYQCSCCGDHYRKTIFDSAKDLRELYQIWLPGQPTEPTSTDEMPF